MSFIDCFYSFLCCPCRSVHVVCDFSGCRVNRPSSQTVHNHGKLNGKIYGRKKVQKKQGGPHRRGDSLGAGLQLEPEASEGTRTWIQPSRSWDNVRGDSPGPRTSRKSKSQSLEEEWRSSAATSLCLNRSKVSAASSSWFHSWDEGFILQQDLAAPQMDPPPRRAVKGAPTKSWGPNISC